MFLHVNVVHVHVHYAQMYFTWTSECKQDISS